MSRQPDIVKEPLDIEDLMRVGQVCFVLRVKLLNTLSALKQG